MGTLLKLFVEKYFESINLKLELLEPEIIKSRFQPE
jgi:hypothetical protein